MKTRMQFRMSRQLVTGLTVNSKVNVRPEYYRLARAMCSSLFGKGTYHLPAIAPAAGGAAAAPAPITSLGTLEGILSHIYHVKDTVDERDRLEKRKNATAARKLYARFLKYRYFVRLERPLIVCEGKTRQRVPEIRAAETSGLSSQARDRGREHLSSALSFFNYRNQAHQILELGGGTGDLRYFFIQNRYKQDIHSFKHRPLLRADPGSS